MRVGHGWDSSVFAGVENEGFKIYDFAFELNFLGFLCVCFSRKFLGMNLRNMNMSFRKNNERINFFNLIILFYFKRIKKKHENVFFFYNYFMLTWHLLNNK